MRDDDERLDDEPAGRRRRSKKDEAPPPNRVAEVILGQRQLITDGVDAVYEYAGGCWLEVPEATLKQYALEADGAAHTSMRRRAEIVSYLKARTHRPGLKWGRVADSEVAASNGVIDVLTGDMRGHRPADYLERVLPIAYAPGAQCPSWLAALETWFGPSSDEAGDPPEVVALQEFFGYVVLSHAKYKQALLLKGGGDTGKSVVIYTLVQLVGELNTCSLPVEQMDDVQRRAVIRGKLLNVISEISAEGLIADGGFKQLVSTEEPILIDEKYKKPEMYIPRAKHAIATNVLPRLNDRTEASLNRLLIIPMLRAVPKDMQDEGLKGRLVDELAGILCWAIEGARRLVSSGGQFSKVPAAAAMLAELRQDANPVRAWLIERTEEDPVKATALWKLTDDYNSWNRGSRKVTSRYFAKMLRDAGRETKVVREGKEVQTCALGLRLVERELKQSFDIDDRAWSSASEVPAASEKRRGAADANL